MRYLGFSILALFVLEIVSIVAVTHWLGGVATLLLMAVSFFIGMLMLRNLGFSAVVMAGDALRSKQGVSLYQMLWPIRFILAGLLLLSPGFASDVAALLLMLPFKGTPIAQADLSGSMGQRRQPHDPDVIEGEYSVHSEAATEGEAEPLRLPHQNKH